MLTRRSLLTGGVLAGTFGDGGGRPAVAADQSGRSGGGNTDEALVKAVEDIRELMRADSGVSSPEINNIRGLQRDFLKGHGKFPDFIEVGIDVWEAIVNWHIRTRQQPQVTRTADGRYAMALFQTNLVLRSDVTNAYVGQPYDAK